MVSAIQSGAAEQLRYTPTQESSKDDSFKAFGDDGFTFFDAIDIINPLHHLPVIGPLYRELTGDTLDPFSRIAGGSLFFGPLGTAVSSANVAMQEMTGNDMGGHVIALFKDNQAPAGETEIAETPAAATPEARQRALDPVTAWAMSEITYRNSEATKQGMAPPLRSYSTMLANAAPLPASQQMADFIPTSKQTRNATPPAAASPGLLALNDVRNHAHASPATADQLKRRSRAYQAVSLQRPEPQSDQPIGRPKSRTDARSAPSGAIVPQDPWFSSTMIDALAKLRHPEEASITPGNRPLEKASLQ